LAIPKFCRYSCFIQPLDFFLSYIPGGFESNMQAASAQVFDVGLSLFDKAFKEPLVGFEMGYNGRREEVGSPLQKESAAPS
jgi:hypothetical protein